MQPQMKVALGGGGGAADSRLLDEVFAAWIGAQGKLLYLPCALRGIRPFQACLEWITVTFASFNVTNITMWTDLSEHQVSELDQFNAVYIGGGNTFALLSELRKSRFENHLSEYVRCGKAVYGGSAGAAVLGRDIRTVNYLDRNEVGLVKTKGLDLAEGHAIWVHYQPQDDNLIDAYVRQYQQPVIALSERSGIVIEQNNMRAVGIEPAYRVDAHGKSEVRDNAEHSIPALVAGGLAFNSLLSIIPMVLIWVPGAIFATTIEDRMLHDELAGYAHHTAKVRYRLIPGVW